MIGTRRRWAIACRFDDFAVLDLCYVSLLHFHWRNRRQHDWIRAPSQDVEGEPLSGEMLQLGDTSARRQSVLDHCDEGFDDFIAGSVAVRPVPYQNPIHDAQHEERSEL